VVKLDKIYTKGGDKGYTSLGDGTRVSKDHLRIRVIGVVDEVNAYIGLVRLHTNQDLQEILSDIQHDLFDLGADLCIPVRENPKKVPLRLQLQQVERLENIIDTFNSQLKPLTSFILPGGSSASTYLHLARVVTRRAERSLVTLSEKEIINETCIPYLNRLSDLLFVLCRYLNDKGEKDVLWKPAKTV
jgi:cob(I)alamin adenosyltransferase